MKNFFFEFYCRLQIGTTKNIHKRVTGLNKFINTSKVSENSRIRLAIFMVWDTNIEIPNLFYHSHNITESAPKRQTRSLQSASRVMLIYLTFFSISTRNCLRRIMHDDQEFSNQSIMYAIEKFVKTVNSMEETILIPSRLMDRQVNECN